MSLKLTIKTSYKKLNNVTGRRETRFVWTISTNSPKELEAYRLEQGDNFREDENNKPLFFSKQYPGTRNAELERVTLTDGTVIYRISMLEKELKIQDMMLGKLAELEAQAEFYGNTVAAAPAGPAIRTIQNAPEILEEQPAGDTGAGGTGANQGLGDGI